MLHSGGEKIAFQVEVGAYCSDPLCDISPEQSLVVSFTAFGSVELSASSSCLTSLRTHFHSGSPKSSLSNGEHLGVTSH